MKFKQKLNKLKVLILLVTILSSYLFIIPNKVHAEEHEYYYYSKLSSVEAVGNMLKGKWEGASVKTIRLVRTEHKYKVSSTSGKMHYYTIGGLTYSQASAYKVGGGYNGGTIKTVSMNPSTYNYGANEHNQYKVKIGIYKTETSTYTTDWKTSSSIGTIVDTRYYYKIITTSASTEILTDENGKKYKNTSYLSDGTILEKTYLKDNGEVDYVNKYNKETGNLECKIEYKNGNQKVKETKYYEEENKRDEYWLKKEFEIIYDNDGKWSEKIYYSEWREEYFRLVNMKNDFYDFKFSNGQENVTFTVIENSRKKDEVPTVELDWTQREGILYEVEDQGTNTKTYVIVDDINAYKNGGNCKMAVHKSQMYIHSRPSEEFIYNVNRQEKDR